MLPKTSGLRKRKKVNRQFKSNLQTQEIIYVQQTSMLTTDVPFMQKPVRAIGSILEKEIHHYELEPK